MADLATDTVNLTFDWDPMVTDAGCLIFHARLDRGDRPRSFDMSIDLGQLQKPYLEVLQSVLAGFHDGLFKPEGKVAIIRWLLNIALAQEGVNPAERATRIRELMLCAPTTLQASPKERLFAAHDINFLRESTLKDFQEQTKALRGYPEVRRAWQQTVRAFNVGTPKLETNSLEEQAELEHFFLQLRHEPMSTAFVTHRGLVDKYSSNPLFRKAVAETITHPPDQEAMPLEYYVLSGWLTSCLWLVTNEDRAVLLNQVYGVTEASADGVRKAIGRLGQLLDWNNFQPKGTRAPCSVTVWTEDGQQWCQISPQM